MGTSDVSSSSAAPQDEDVTPAGEGVRQAYAFRGTITELRQLEPAREGMPLVLEDVVVLSTSNKDNRYYVADAMGGEYAGIEVVACEACTDRSEPGTIVDVEGVLSVESGERYLVIGARLRSQSNARAEVPAVELPSPLASPQETDSGRFVGGYVVLVDADTEAPSQFRVVDLAPAAAQQVEYPAECTLERADAACCEHGPKYRYFVVEELRTGSRVHVATAAWQQWAFRVWPCAPDDLARVVKSGAVISRLAGVLDVQESEALIVPVGPDDIALAQ